jgi:hypothetical protein
LLKRILKLGATSISFGTGTVFGATIATLVSAAIYGVFGFKAADILLINECMIEKISEQLGEEVSEEVVEEISE